MNRMRQVALVYGAVLLSASVASTVVSTQTGNPPTQAPTGIDNRTVDTATANQAQHIADEETFAEHDGIEGARTDLQHAVVRRLPSAADHRRHQPGRRVESRFPVERRVHAGDGDGQRGRRRRARDDCRPIAHQSRSDLSRGDRRCRRHDDVQLPQHRRPRADRQRLEQR